MSCPAATRAQLLGVPTARDPFRQWSLPFVWNIPNPFASGPQTRRYNIAEARARHYEAIGPLDPVYSDGESGYESDSDDSKDDEGEDEDDLSDVDRPNAIALPKLLHTTPLCYVAPTPPSPTFSYSSESDGDDLDQEDAWAELAQAHNDAAEADERARKAKRDAYRSRMKALAILGPEASSALPAITN